MPIRFRCAYCNQLLGIARRKSGTVVRCPTCAGQVVVPNMDEEPAPDRNDQVPMPAPTGGGQQFFEGSEIDKLLEGEGGDQPSALSNVGRQTMRPAMVPPSPAAPVPAPVAVMQAPAPMAIQAPMNVPMQGPRPPGIWLSPARATLLSVMAVVALAVSFGVGLLVGLFIGHK